MTVNVIFLKYVGVRSLQKIHRSAGSISSLDHYLNHQILTEGILCFIYTYLYVDHVCSVKTEQEGGHLQTEKRALTRPSQASTLIADFQPPEL